MTMMYYFQRRLLRMVLIFPTLILLSLTMLIASDSPTCTRCVVVWDVLIKKAFCYLLAPPLAALNPEARRRLEALETFSDLGSGFNLAMQDLDIRGAGNLLGSEQSGFMEDLGYETYQKNPQSGGDGAEK